MLHLPTAFYDSISESGKMMYLFSGGKQKNVGKSKQMCYHKKKE